MEIPIFACFTFCFYSFVIGVIFGAIGILKDY